MTKATEDDIAAYASEYPKDGYRKLKARMAADGLDASEARIRHQIRSYAR